MTDEREKEAAKEPPEPVEGAEGLPDDTTDGEVDGTPTTTVTITGDDLVVTETPEARIPDGDWPSPGYITPEPDPTGPEYRAGE